jgi:hypothetical protein
MYFIIPDHLKQSDQFVACFGNHPQERIAALNKLNPIEPNLKVIKAIMSLDENTSVRKAAAGIIKKTSLN